MKWINHILWYEICACKCRLNARVCKDKQCRNSDKSKFEYNKLDNKAWCDHAFIWNPSICEWECYKSCEVEGYLDYAHCKCRKRLIDIDGNKMVYNVTLSGYEGICKSFKLYMVLIIITLIIIFEYDR